ncbi:helix-turn-helix transcriptional regulator [Chlorobium sp. N1]|uniref:helix-turn-helix domain-containing protein n=1 Tax=Chlorobium sp. N1 TaxID=2491138 RepID=UPI00103DDE36|nr:helix-turn-helix transcriptional regulator [Chlorobium sp. N1]TCD47192.1 XRE family transcriptional regulator [Chlorobium sp. N1]
MLALQLGRNIRAERSRNGWSQERLAEESRLHRTYVGVIERGEKRITVCNCKKIACALGLPLWELIRMSEENGLSE